MSQSSNSHSSPVSLARKGLSLVELLIAMVVTLIVLVAMMALFQYGSVEMKRGRAAVDLTTRLQAVEEQLRLDLDQITVDIKPHHQLPANPKGYFEIVEGIGRDYVPSSFNVNPIHNGDNAHRGDTDDFIAFTIKSSGSPFWQNNTSSLFGEVAWYVSGRRIIRNFRLIRGFDSNVMAGLGIRSRRIGHKGGTNPHTSDLDFSRLDADPSDVLLSNVIAFDVQVFDPDANQYLVRETDSRDIIGVANATEVGAIEGVPGGKFDPVSQGAFIDLGINRFGTPGNKPVFFNPPHPRYEREAVYDTGTSLYDNNQTNDTGNNGVDDLPLFQDGERNGIVDDVEEKESIAPYNQRLRGIKITIRVIEPNTKLVRQISVVKSFVAQ